MKKLLFTAIFFIFILNVHADQWGLASWYGDEFHGKKTANGEIFDTNTLTAAHKTLPFNTLVKVTNLYNQKSTTVRINDRGPFRKGRIIDLSHAAAQELDMLDSGVIPVRLEVVADSHEERKASGAKDYRIQIGAFREVSNAEKTKELVQQKNLPALIEATNNGFYRVYVDQVAENALADIKKTLQDLGFRDFIIRELK
jgi:rare lipoprotein A